MLGWGWYYFGRFVLIINFLINSISIYLIPLIVAFTYRITLQTMNDAKMNEAKIQRNFLKTTISSRLKCPICFEVFYKPRRLFCGYFPSYSVTPSASLACSNSATSNTTRTQNMSTPVPSAELSSISAK